MKIVLREPQQSDIPFMRKMLYEAIFWRAAADKPSFAEAIADPEVSKAVADWGGRAGDTAVLAAINSVPAGAAWYRYWTDDNFINGYIHEKTPVLVIGVQRAYRRQGIGGQMIAWLIDQAAQQAVAKISLSVSKDNHALNLYKQQGFVEYADKGDALLMVRKI